MSCLKGIKTFAGLLKDDFANPSQRFLCLCKLLSVLPGSAGAYLRTSILHRSLASFGENSSFLGSVRIIRPENLHIGKNVLFNEDVYIQSSGGVTIGDYSVFGPSVKIWSLNHIFSDPNTWIPEQGYEYLPVHIGKHVWIGANVFIMPGAEIGDYSIISAGSVIGKKKVRPGSILAGNPARKVGTRPTV